MLYKKYLRNGINTKVFEVLKQLQNKIANLRIKVTNFIPEYLINLMTLTYSSKHSGQFLKRF